MCVRCFNLVKVRVNNLYYVFCRLNCFEPFFSDKYITYMSFLYLLLWRDTLFSLSALPPNCCYRLMIYFLVKSLKERIFKIIICISLKRWKNRNFSCETVFLYTFYEVSSMTPRCPRHRGAWFGGALWSWLSGV